MADKNHEQYLEQIETAVAETTMDILEKHSGDLRAMAKLVAEKQVEINRLKEYHSEERKTIRNLRKLLKECNSERECNSHDVRQLENTREAVRKALGVEPDPTDETLVKKIEELYKAACECRRMADDYDNVSLAAQLRKEENDKLKEEIELQKDYIDALPERLEEKQEYLEQAQLDIIAKDFRIERLTDELECRHSTWETKEGEYEAEIEKLKQEIRRSDHDACSHLRQILELKEKLKSV